MFGIAPGIEQSREYQRFIQDPWADEEFLGYVRAEMNRRISAEAAQADALWLGGAKEAENGTRAIEGLGEGVLQLPTFARNYLRNVEHADLGSRDDVKTIKKLFPQAAVKCGGSRIQQGYRAPVNADYETSAERRKFRKVYPQ